MKMLMTRRAAIAGAAVAIVVPAAYGQPEDRNVAKLKFEEEFNGIPDPSRGFGPPVEADINTVVEIVGSDYLISSNPHEIMVKLSQLDTPINKARFPSSNGLPFNQRWPDRANPLLIKFFRDIGYPRTPYPGDCTPWCAATIAWCLQRAGFAIPGDPASAQSFKNYGTRVSTPQPGDICVFGDIGDPPHGHVGFFDGFVDQQHSILKVLGGNQSGNGATTCGANFPQSHIGVAQIPVNSGRNRRVGYHYLIGYARPVPA
jgi:uncharacterized protein (TIGR02594 family)